MKSSPGHTTLAECQIKTPQLSFRLAYVYRDTVKKELDEIQKCEISEPSSSEWASPINGCSKEEGWDNETIIDFEFTIAADAYQLASTKLIILLIMTSLI